MNVAKYNMPYALFTWTVQNIPGNTHQKGQVRMRAGSAVFKTQLLESIGEVLWKISRSKFLIKSRTKKKANRRIFFPDFSSLENLGQGTGGEPLLYPYRIQTGHASCISNLQTTRAVGKKDGSTTTRSPEIFSPVQSTAARTCCQHFGRALSPPTPR